MVIYQAFNNPVKKKYYEAAGLLFLLLAFDILTWKRSLKANEQHG